MPQEKKLTKRELDNIRKSEYTKDIYKPEDVIQIYSEIQNHKQRKIKGDIFCAECGKHTGELSGFFDDKEKIALNHIGNPASIIEWVKKGKREIARIHSFYCSKQCALKAFMKSKGDAELEVRMGWDH